MIKVTVAGGCGTGKSAISYLIVKMLREHGFEACVSFLDGESEFDVSQNISRKIDSIKLKESIEIVEKQLLRSSLCEITDTVNN